MTSKFQQFRQFINHHHKDIIGTILGLTLIVLIERFRFGAW